MYIFVAIRENSVDSSFLFDTWDAVHAATFSPDIDYTIVPLKTRGRSYRERKDDLRKRAQDMQNADFGGLACNEIAALTDYFERAGKRYGLLKEFRENAII